MPVALRASGLKNPARFPVAAATLLTAALLFSSHAARATGGALPPAGMSEATTLDLEVAVAASTEGSTRWSRLTVGGPFTVLWLVPVRPGAALDWASDAWLDSLEAASAPRILPPEGEPVGCLFGPKAEETERWGQRGATTYPRTLAYQPTAGAARTYARDRGFGVSAAVAARIDGTYAAGYGLVALEVTAGQEIVSTPTLRVSDDGPAVLPFALSGSSRASVRLTALIVGEGGASVPEVVEPAPVLWTARGSDHAARRLEALAAAPGLSWIRESASHDALFDGVVVDAATSIRPAAGAYFDAAGGPQHAACEQAARSVGTASGHVGRSCASGALLRVPGGTGCQPTAGSIDPALLTCGGADDLALALAGAAPGSAALTRLVGFVPQGRFGADVAITTGQALVSPAQRASSYAPCGLNQPAASAPSAPAERPHHYEHAEGACSGSTSSVVYEDTGEEETIADDSCGGDSSTTSTSSDSTASDDGTDDSSDDSSTDDSSTDDSSGWDTKDDTSSSDSCSSSTDSTSDSSDDSCSSSSSSSSNDGCSSGPDARPKASGMQHRGKRKHRGSSPMSRYALLFVALVLPLRRGLRAKKL
ncbi:MAG: Endo,4-beta-xylanase precursor [Labilithrix sp.]|nr:Endo,4-beta-xylanase precursor [Labilithrix sp.]